MTPDHYAELEVAPTAEDVVIHAAYLALLRRNNPDKNPSAGAAARGRAIIAAYSVLGDPNRRAEYDRTRTQRAAESPSNRHLHRLKLSFTALFTAAAAWGRRAITAANTLTNALRRDTVSDSTRTHVQPAKAAVEAPERRLKPTLADLFAAAAAAHGHAIPTAHALLSRWQPPTKRQSSGAHVRSAIRGADSPWWPRSNLIPILGAAATLLLLLLLLIPPPLSVGERPARLADVQSRQAAAPKAQLDSAARCTSAATSELIKRELFRRAARVRGSDHRAFERLAAHALIRLGSPILTRANPDLSTFSCRASVALDLPPGVAVHGGRRSLTADISYSLKAVDGVEAVSLSNQGGIVMPLATLAQIPRSLSNRLDSSDETAKGAGDQRPPLVGQAPVPALPPAAHVEPQPAPRPTTSFSCRFAHGRGEIAVCNSANLAALDRNMALLYSQSLGRANAAKRMLLIHNHHRFVAHRDACSSEACIRALYIARMREITEVMAGQQPPG